MATSITARFHAGLDLEQNGEHDRAAAIFAECVAADPIDFEFVDAFLGNLERKLQASLVIEEQKLSPTLQFAIQGKQWDEVRRLGPAYLLSHPHHVPLLRALAEAAASFGHYNVELRYLQAAARASPDSVEVNRHRARSLVRQGQFDVALECWGKVQDVAPEDAEATAMLAQLTIEQSRQRNGLEGAHTRPGGSLRKPAETVGGLKPIVYQDERMLREILRQAEEHKRTPVQQLEVALREYSANPDLYLKLASLYMEKGRDYDAEKLLVKAKDLCDDQRVAAYWEDVMMVRLDRKLAAATTQLESDDSEASRAAVAEARKARDRFQTEVFLNRCKREPNNAELRYELGLRHKQAGKAREAYECFVVALNDDKYRALAAYEMADCLKTADKLVEAMQYYRMAIESAQPDQLECKKQALLQAGVLTAGMRLKRLARRYVERLQRIDPEYASRATGVGQGSP